MAANKDSSDEGSVGSFILPKRKSLSSGNRRMNATRGPSPQAFAAMQEKIGTTRRDASPEKRSKSTRGTAAQAETPPAQVPETKLDQQIAVDVTGLTKTKLNKMREAEVVAIAHSLGLEADVKDLKADTVAKVLKAIEDP